MKGLLCTVLRPADANERAAAARITGKATHVLLVGESIARTHDSIELPFVKLVQRRISGEIFTVAYPPEVDDNLARNGYPTGYIFGGNFIWSADSRFPSRQPIPVYDAPDR